MPEANKSILAGLQAYVANKNAGMGGGPKTGIPDNAKTVATDKSKLDDMLDLRDSISALVGSGYTPKATDPTVLAHRTRILNMMPAQEAQNLLTHIAIQNQQPGVQTLSPTQRLQRFYDIQSSIPATNMLLQKVKSLGTGPISAFSETPDGLNQQLAAAPVVVKK